MQRTAKIAVVAEQPDIRSLEGKLSEVSSPLRSSIEVRFIGLSLQDPIDPACAASDQIREHDPDVIVIGQTERAEDILARLRMMASPLVVRWSRFYGNDKPAYTSKTPSAAGYHLDMPKTAEAFRLFVENKQLIEAICLRDGPSVRRCLPASVKVFDRFEAWAAGRSTPPLDIPITDFVYLDDDGIAQLFAQSGRQHLESVVRKSTRSTSGKAMASLRIGKILELFGIGGAEAGGEVDHAKTFSEEFTEKLDTVGKLKIVVDALMNSRMLHTVDTEHCYDLRSVNDAVFADVAGWFNTKDDILRIAMSPDPSEEFVQFECCNAPILLGASISKFRLGIHHVSVQFGLGESRLRVFGKLTPLESEFYLKPYAFWQTHGRVCRH